MEEALRSAANYDIRIPADGSVERAPHLIPLETAARQETTPDPRRLASPARFQIVIYPLTSVDWVWISGGTVGMERAAGREGG